MVPQNRKTSQRTRQEVCEEMRWGGGYFNPQCEENQRRSLIVDNLDFLRKFRKLGS